MGVAEDPELEVWLGRQMVRVYDATLPPGDEFDARARLNAEPQPHRKQRPGGLLQLSSGEHCGCGRCLFETHCPTPRIR